jgi:putative DNA primase/helicase
MADLTSIFGGAWSPPAEKYIAPAEDQLRDAIASAGLEPPDTLHLDGKLHRFKAGTKGSPGHGDKSGWYVCFADGIPAGRFGDWRSGVEVTFRADMGRTFTPTEEMALTRRMTEAKALRDAETKKSQEVAANTVDSIWSNCMGASDDHPYLKRKGIASNGARVTGDGRLVVPLYDEDGTLATLQYIDHEGGKLYHPGGATGGKFNIIGVPDESKTLYMAEGFATAATIHEKTGAACVVAYSASNLVPVTEALHNTYKDIVIVADHDASGVGHKYAEQASAKYGARMVMPPSLGDANDYAQAGNDLLSLLNPPKDDWLVPADEFCAQPAPVSWLVKGWLQDQALVMVHGPSGGGKTFVVLDWCLRMASGITEWMGHKVRPANVVYLAGEGHHGLKSRIAGWKNHNAQDKLNMWLSKAGCDLNTSAGYLKVVSNLRAMPVKPDVIVVDTLHRFLAGDENSSQDAKTMLDACAALMKEFNCTVVLVHHTGVSDEAQHRARGSSAWRGALDIEISIVPAKDEQPMQIIQRKSKDAEMSVTVHVNLISIPIPGWFDEDQEQVTTAVLVGAEAVVKVKIDTTMADFRHRIKEAWYFGKCEQRQGLPYISRSGLKAKMEQDGRKERTIENDLSPSYKNKLIGALLDANIIQAHEHGWIVVEPEQSGLMMMGISG